MSARPTTSTVQKKPQAVVNTEQAAAKEPTPIRVPPKGHPRKKKAERTFPDYSDAEFRTLSDADLYILVRINPQSGEMSTRTNKVDEAAAVVNLAKIVASSAEGVIGALADGAARYAAIQQVTNIAPQQQAK